MKVTIELETAEEREMMGASDTGRFVKARSTAIFFRREMVPMANYQTGFPIHYKEQLYIEVGLSDLEYVYVKPIPELQQSNRRNDE